jgi:hypothetical protein
MLFTAFILIVAVFATLRWSVRQPERASNTLTRIEKLFVRPGERKLE